MIQYMVSFLHYLTWHHFYIITCVWSFIKLYSLLDIADIFRLCAFSSSFIQNGTDRKGICLILWPGRL